MQYHCDFEVKCSGTLNSDLEISDFTVELFGEDITDKLDAFQLESLQEQFIEDQSDADEMGGE